MADFKVKHNVITASKAKAGESTGSTEAIVNEKEDSVEDAIEQLEKTLQNSENDNTIDHELCKNGNSLKRIRRRNSSGSSEHSYIVLDEFGEDSELLNDLKSFSHSCDDVTDITVAHKSPEKDSDISSVSVVIHDSPQKSNEDNSIIFYDKTDCDNKSVIICDNAEKENVIGLSTNPKRDGKVVCGTPSFSNDENIFNNKKKFRKLLATSTPYRQVSIKNENGDSSNNSEYKPPARSILEKWKPHCRLNQTQNIDQGIDDISAISCADTSRKSVISNSDEETEIMKKSEFEEAFLNLYVTLFGDNDEKGATPLNSNAKLKLYHDNIVKQHAQDSVKFNEIISEISSISSKNFVSEKFDSINNCVDDESKNSLSTIDESSEESCDNKTVIVNDCTIVNRDDINSEGDNDEGNELKLNLKMLVDDKEAQNEITENINDANDEEVLEVPVINGANSIIYLNNKELTLDEEDALLNDDLDVISLVCSDIESITPRTDDASNTISVKPAIDSAKLSDPIIKSEVPDDTPPDFNQIPNSDIVLIKTEVPVDIKCEPIPLMQTVEDIKPPLIQQVPSASASVATDRNAIFISDNPKENEDNNDPEWEHLRRLSNDKERYKALRERWHSIVIPDPNLDLTSQTYRQRRLAKQNRNVNSRVNKMSATSTVTTATATSDCDSKVDVIGSSQGFSRKRPRPTDDYYDSASNAQPIKKRKLCTLLFEQNIESLLRKLEFKRYRMHQELDRELTNLATKQENEFAHWASQRLPPHVFDRLCRDLHTKQTVEVCNLRQKYEAGIKAAEIETNEYVSALNAATEEVLTFHKFYQDLDSANNNTSSSMYLSNMQIQELVETEHMLELYSKFYRSN